MRGYVGSEWRAKQFRFERKRHFILQDRKGGEPEIQKY